MMQRFAMTCLVLMMWLSANAWAETPVTPYGVWRGVLTETDVAGSRYSRYAVTLTLAPKRYHVDYDSLGCGGGLRLVHKSGHFFQFQDEMDYGLDACSSGGRTELHIIGPERAAFQWFDADGVLKAEGYLERHRQVMI